MMKRTSLRRIKPPKKKLESIRLQEENLRLEKKIQEMSKFVEKEKRKDRLRKKKKPVMKHKSIRGKNYFEKLGFASNILKKHNTQGGVKFKKRGLRAYDEIVKKKIALKRQGGGEFLKLKKFFEANNLQEYLIEFKNEGIDSIDALFEFDIKKIGMKPGHEIKLKRRIEALKRIRNDKSEVKIGSKGGKLQAIVERRQSLKGNQLPEKKKDMKNPKKELKRNNSKFIKKKNFVVVKKKTSCSTSTETQTATQEVKGSCWLCCKMFEEKEKVEHPLLDGKKFCSKECLKGEFKNISSKCETCSRIVLKTIGFLKEENWFCSEECLGKLKGEEEIIEVVEEDIVKEDESEDFEDEDFEVEIDLDMDFEF